jgi:N-acetylglucosamine-6-phosphate deacetylase
MLAMPTPVPTNMHHLTEGIITKFTNCRLLRGDELIDEDLWISSEAGKILDGQEVFYSYQSAPDNVIDLGGRIISPGLIDVQLNGAFGFDLSVAPEDITDYVKGLIAINRGLIKTGVTSYAPTLTSQKSEVYHKVRQNVLYLDRPPLMMRGVGVTFPWTLRMAEMCQ